MKIRSLVAATVCGLLAAAGATIPDTPAGQQFAHWLEVFNAGKREEIQKFLEQNRPEAAQRLDQEIGFRQMTGGFDLKKIEETTPEKITGIVKERDSDNYARFVMQVAPGPPHQITSFGLQLIPRPAEFQAASRLSEQDAIAALKADLHERTVEDRFAGAIAVAKGRKLVFSGAYGMADRERQVPNRVDTRFRIGSMNKMFTATAVLQLAQAGKLKLTDPLGKYLTDYPNKDIASKVTIHQLLTHTGGTGDIFGPEFEKNRLTLRVLGDYVGLYGKRAPQFARGARFAYSNYGFILLGVIVEKVSGQDYYEYVRRHIFKPAEM